MTGGADLLGASSETPPKRGPGRPKGAKGKRSAELHGYIAAKYGSSAAQQSAALCMVTPAELRKAGGSMAKAQVNKALDLVEYVRGAQGGLDEALRQVVRDALRDLAADMGEADVRELKALVNGFLGRVKEASSPFGLVQALKLIADERAALLPYTDKKQPVAVELPGAAAPAVVLQVEVAAGGAAMPLDATDVEFVEVFQPAAAPVSQPKSHDGDQPFEITGLLPPPAAD